MANSNKLNNTHVVITRPQHQAMALAKKIIAEGGNTYLFPAIAIAPPADPEQLRELREIIKTLDKCSIAIFVSANAVLHSQHIVHELWPILPKNLQIAAIGSGTRRALEQAGLSVSIMPSREFNSEALLALPPFKNIRGKRVMIFAGAGGRGLLPDALSKRGAKVSKVICYRRCLPQADISDLISACKQNSIDIVVTTSKEGLNNLFAMTNTAGQAILINKPVLVISEGMVAQAQTLGFKNTIIQAKNASNDAILSALIAWKEEKHDYKQ